MANNGPPHLLIVRPLPDHTGRDPEGWLRLRAWLKAGLRGYRIQAVRITEPTPEQVAQADREVNRG